MSRITRQQRSAIKKGLKELLRQNGFKNVRVWNIEEDKDYTGKKWINIEVSADTKKSK